MHVNVETQMSYAVSYRANQSPTGLSLCHLLFLPTLWFLSLIF